MHGRALSDDRKPSSRVGDQNHVVSLKLRGAEAMPERGQRLLGYPGLAVDHRA